MKIKGVLCFIGIVLSFQWAWAGIYPTALKCEHMENPSVVDELHPRLSWINETNDELVQGECQTAYRICVATSKEKLLKNEADVWDTDKILSSTSYLIPFNGEPLVSAQTYWWHVKVWNKDGEESVWSEPACWGMGLLNANEWQAKWIGIEEDHGASPMFRKSFDVKKKVTQAKAFVTALGYYELYINGNG